MKKLTFAFLLLSGCSLINEWNSAAIVPDAFEIRSARFSVWRRHCSVVVFPVDSFNEVAMSESEFSQILLSELDAPDDFLHRMLRITISYGASCLERSQRDAYDEMIDSDYIQVFVWGIANTVLVYDPRESEIWVVLR